MTLEWISVNDRLPDQREEPDFLNKIYRVSDRVLVAGRFPDGPEFIQFDRLVDDDWEFYGGEDSNCPGCTITYWMPRPRYPIDVNERDVVAGG